MRRTLFLALALLAAFAVAVPVADAQTPNPNAKVTISGLIDNVGTFTRNMSAFDFNLARNSDRQFYGRTRGRFDIIGEIGKAKAVLGIEIDEYWGQTGLGDSNGAGSTTCQSAANSGTVNCGFVGSGAESSFDLNTDTQSNLQIKWLYTEFPLPLVPVPTTVRLGGQPFGTAANWKLAVYANGDFGGANVVMNVTPNVKLLFTYVAVEENLTGKKDVPPVFSAFAPLPSGSFLGGNKCQTSAPISPCTPQTRNDNYALIFSAEVTPIKGLDIKPMYSFFDATGQTNANARQGRGGLTTATIISGTTGGQISSPFAPAGASGAPTFTTPTWSADGSGTGIHEYRHTIGVDGRWRSGPWSVEPTFLYQFGSRQAVVQNFSGGAGQLLSGYGALGRKYTANINAWLADVRAGYQLGPWLFSALGMWTSGDPAKSNPFRSVGFFQALDTDTSYMADWGTQIMSLGVDYYQILNGGAAQAGLNPGVAIGYDKYGRKSFGFKANYAWTPTFNVWAGVTPTWTDKPVDTNGSLILNGGILPSFVNKVTLVTSRPQFFTDSAATEIYTGLTWKFADGLTFDWAAGYLFAGAGLGHRLTTTTYNVIAPSPKDGKVNDVIITTARVRYVF